MKLLLLHLLSPRFLPLMFIGVLRKRYHRGRRTHSLQCQLAPRHYLPMKPTLIVIWRVADTAHPHFAYSAELSGIWAGAAFPTTSASCWPNTGRRARASACCSSPCSGPGKCAISRHRSSARPTRIVFAGRYFVRLEQEQASMSWIHESTMSPITGYGHFSGGCKLFTGAQDFDFDDFLFR